jgi:hypothetical protein
MSKRRELAELKAIEEVVLGVTYEFVVVMQRSRSILDGRRPPPVHRATFLACTYKEAKQLAHDKWSPWAQSEGYDLSTIEVECRINPLPGPGKRNAWDVGEGHKIPGGAKNRLLALVHARRNAPRR